MDTSMENIAYKSFYMRLKAEYDQTLVNMLELEDEKNKAIEKQQHLQTQNEDLTFKLGQAETTLNDLRNQIKDLKDELEKTKRKNSRKRKYNEQDARIIHDALKKYGGTLTYRQAAKRFNISTSTIQLLMKEYE
ncbi:MAG: hypothetical protein IKZ66_01310 [Schwartzia sp.]|nr:hypothetical protein [Schwartzia sp. (in: firmicutes)]